MNQDQLMNDILEANRIIGRAWIQTADGFDYAGMKMLHAMSYLREQASDIQRRMCEPDEIEISPLELVAMEAAHGIS